LLASYFGLFFVFPLSPPLIVEPTIVSWVWVLLFGPIVPRFNLSLPVLFLEPLPVCFFGWGVGSGPPFLKQIFATLHLGLKKRGHGFAIWGHAIFFFWIAFF